jgi:pyruvate/2-oxoglutarate dehydrogenase complex dihydrolipoamide dehydrogenase (E3) component
MPQDFRIEKVRKILGPAPCWFTRELVVGKMEIHTGVTVESASVHNDRVSLQLVDRSGARKTVSADHVIAATGYKPNLGRLDFLDADIISAIQRVDTSPALTSNFESTVPSLYFVGISAANTFGPLLRFAYGAGYAAPRIAKHLARTAGRAPAPAQIKPQSHAAIEDNTATMAR